MFCITEFLRVVTHARVFSPPSTVTQATGFVEVLAAAPTREVVRPGADFLERLLATVRKAGARGNLMFDAQIVALCREHGIDSILTNDRDFERFETPRALRLEENQLKRY